MNTYALNIAAPTCIKQMFTDPKGAVGSNTMMLRDFVVSLTSVDRSFRKKIEKEALALAH